MTERENILGKFLSDNGWQNIKMVNIAGDASFRKYFRLSNGDSRVILMDAPPPQEDVRPFINIARFLKSNGYSAPDIIASDEENGFLLLEDLNDDRYTRILSDKSSLSEAPSEEKLYKAAIDVLISLYECEYPSSAMKKYDNTLLMKEALLLTEWYLPLIYEESKIKQLEEEYVEIWNNLLPLTHMDKEVVVCRDYHADNLMWLPEREGIKKVGMLDFQDAVIGSPAYDLVSLLEDARRDVDFDFAEKMISYYLERNKEIDKEKFLLSYAVLGAQRNCKIVGIFSRLAIRDNKADYLNFIPRVWNYITHGIKHPPLNSLKLWVDKNIPEVNRKKAPRVVKK